MTKDKPQPTEGDVLEALKEQIMECTQDKKAKYFKIEKGHDLGVVLACIVNQINRDTALSRQPQDDESYIKKMEREYPLGSVWETEGVWIVTGKQCKPKQHLKHGLFQF